jgi:hypothetical protein
MIPLDVNIFSSSELLMRVLPLHGKTAAADVISIWWTLVNMHRMSIIVFMCPRKHVQDVFVNMHYIERGKAKRARK